MKVCYLNFDGAPTIEAATCNRIGGLNTIVFNLLKQASSLPHLNLSVLYRDDGLNVPNELISLPMILVKKIVAGNQQLLTRIELEACLEEFISGVAVHWQSDKPELVHTAGSEAGFVMMKLRESGFKIPWVHTNYATLAVRRVIVEGNVASEALLGRMEQRELTCLQKCDHVVALSEVDRQEISTVFGIVTDKITVAEPGVNHEIFYPRSCLYRLPVIISAGRMSRIKDFPYLIRCFRHVVDLNPKLNGLKLVIVGGNNKERHEIGLPEMVKDLKLGLKVELTDGVSQRSLSDKFCSAKVFAGVSKHETFGLLPVEARACGTPFVVRSNSSYLATAVDGFGGYFADNGSEQDMACKISHILKMSEPEWAEMSNQAIESTKKFQWSETISTCIHVYRGLLESTNFTS